MLTDVLGALASIVLVCWSCATHQQSARCGPGWWLPEGVRGGWMVCRPKPVGVDARDARGILVDRTEQPPGAIATRLRCTGGAELRQDGESQWCAR